MWSWFSLKCIQIYAGAWTEIHITFIAWVHRQTPDGAQTPACLASYMDKIYIFYFYLIIIMSLHTWSIGICSQIKTYNDHQMTEMTEIFPAFNQSIQYRWKHASSNQPEHLKSSPSVQTLHLYHLLNLKHWPAHYFDTH